MKKTNQKKKNNAVKSNKKNEIQKNVQKENSKINKKTKRKINIKLFLEFTIIIAIIVGAVSFIMTTPLFNITEIDVYGNSKVSKDRIISLSQISLNTNTYKYLKRNISKNVKEEPYVESVTIKRKLPNKIQINIKEREVTYYFKYSSGYVYIDNQGYILEISNEELTVPQIEGCITGQQNIIPGERLCDEDLEKLNIIKKIMETASTNEIGSKITKINIEDKNNYILTLESENKTVYLGDASSINDRMLMLKEILTKEAGNKGKVFIQDLNKIYFRQEN